MTIGVGGSELVSIDPYGREEEENEQREGGDDEEAKDEDWGEDPASADAWYPPVYVAGYLVLYGRDEKHELLVSRDDVQNALPTPAPIPINVDHLQNCTIGAVLALVDDDRGLFFVGKLDCPGLGDVLSKAAKDDLWADFNEDLSAQEKMLYLVANYLPSASLSSKRLMRGERADPSFFAHVALCFLGKRVGTVVSYDSSVESVIRPFKLLSRRAKNDALREAAVSEELLAGVRWYPKGDVLNRALLSTALDNLMLEKRWQIVSERRRQAGIEGHKYLQASVLTPLAGRDSSARRVGEGDPPPSDAGCGTAPAGCRSYVGGAAERPGRGGGFCHSPPEATGLRKRSAETAAGRDVQIADRRESLLISERDGLSSSDDGGARDREGEKESSGVAGRRGMNLVGQPSSSSSSSQQHHQPQQSSAGSASSSVQFPPQTPFSTATANSSSEGFLWVPADCYHRLVMNSHAGGGPFRDTVQASDCSPLGPQTTAQPRSGSFAGLAMAGGGGAWAYPAGVQYFAPQSALGAVQAVPTPAAPQFANSTYGPLLSPYVGPAPCGPYAPQAVSASSKGLEEKIGALIDVISADRMGGGGRGYYGGPSGRSASPPPASYQSQPSAGYGPRGRKRHAEWDEGESARWRDGSAQPYYPGELSDGRGESPRRRYERPEWDGGYSTRSGFGESQYVASPPAKVYRGGGSGGDDARGQQQERALGELLGAVTHLQREVAQLRNGGAPVPDAYYGGPPPQQLPPSVQFGAAANQFAQPQQQQRWPAAGVPASSNYYQFPQQAALNTPVGQPQLVSGPSAGAAVAQQPFSGVATPSDGFAGARGANDAGPAEENYAPADSGEVSVAQQAAPPKPAATPSAVSVPAPRSSGRKAGGHRCAAQIVESTQQQQPQQQTVDASAVHRIGKGGTGGKIEPLCDMFVEQMMGSR